MKTVKIDKEILFFFNLVIFKSFNKKKPPNKNKKNIIFLKKEEKNVYLFFIYATRIYYIFNRNCVIGRYISRVLSFKTQGTPGEHMVPQTQTHGAPGVGHLVFLDYLQISDYNSGRGG